MTLHKIALVVCLAYCTSTTTAQSTADNNTNKPTFNKSEFFTDVMQNNQLDVDMANLAIGKSNNPGVLNLAQQIISDQQKIKLGSAANMTNANPTSLPAPTITNEGNSTPMANTGASSNNNIPTTATTRITGRENNNGIYVQSNPSAMADTNSQGNRIITNNGLTSATGADSLNNNKMYGNRKELDKPRSDANRKVTTGQNSATTDSTTGTKVVATVTNITSKTQLNPDGWVSRDSSRNSRAWDNNAHANNVVGRQSNDIAQSATIPSSFNNLSGPAFDKQWVSQMIINSAKNIAAHESALSVINENNYNTAISNALTILRQRHLALQSINTKL